MQETAKKQVSINKEKHDKLDHWYHAIHEKYGGICQETGKMLQFSKRHAHHVLPKSTYPYFMYDLRNGILVGWSIHHILDWGSEKRKQELKVYPTVMRIRKTLLNEINLEA